MRQRDAVRFAPFFTIAALVLAVASVARAATPTSVDLAARIDGARGLVAGVERIEVEVGEGEHELRLWVWADRLSVAPTGMDERTWRAIYPGEVALGGATIERVDVDGARARPRRMRPTAAAPRDVAGTVWRVPIAAGPARTLVVVVHFRVTVPERFGRLGRADGLLALAGPWMPLVLGADGAWDARPSWQVSVETTDVRDVALGDAVGRSWRGAPVFAETVHGAYVPVLVATRLATVERDTGGPCRVRVVMRDGAGNGALSDLVDGDRGALDHDALDRVTAITGEACRTVAAAGLGALLPTEPVPVLVVPSRTELASTADGVVTISDHAYRVSHIDALLDFHDRAVRAAIFRVLVRPLAATEPAADRPLADELRAALLADADDARRHGHAQTPDELVGFAAFHPTVDQLLYAPQVPFADTYFGYVEEDDRFRDDPREALSLAPRGPRILRNLRETLPAADYRAALHELLGAAALGRAAGDEEDPAAQSRRGIREILGLRLDAWLAAPSRPSAFRLGRVSSARDANGWAHHVEILRAGATSGDPVVVEVEDDRGHRARATWDGEGARGEVVVRTAGALGGVRVDPDGVVPQRADLGDGHPRTDDASGQPWRPPLIAGFELSYSAAEQRVDGLVDLALHQRYDLDHTLGLRLQTGARSVGGILRYIQGVGPLRDLNGRIGALSAGIDIERLRTDFAPTSSPGQEAWSGALLVTAAVDTRVFRNDWRYGWSIVGSLRASGTLHDDGAVHGAFSASVRATVTLPFGLRNALMLVGGAGTSLGDPVPAELQSLGGLGVLRGFAANELLGRSRFYAVAEHRTTVLADLSWNILDLVYVREIQLAAFAGAGLLLGPLGSISRNLGADVDAHFAADGGVGVRFHYLYGGVQPGVMSIDFATPIVSSHFGNEGLRLVGYVSFDQYF